MANLLKNISQETCPVCGEDKVFATKGNVLLFKAPQMKSECEKCGHHYEKEPGYFVGSMYVSYGLCLIEMILVFILYKFTSLPLEYSVYAVVLPVLIFWPFNFRMSRIIWMNII